MQFLRLTFVKKLQLRLLTPTRGLLRPPDPHFSADFSVLNSHVWRGSNPGLPQEVDAVTLGNRGDGRERA